MFCDTPSLNDTNQLVRRMMRIATKFRKANPLQKGPWQCAHYLIPVNSHGRPGHKTLIWYHNRGCAWASEAGCTMCNFGEGREVPEDDLVLADFRAELQRLDPGSRFVHLGPGGSFFVRRELSVEMRRKLVELTTTLPFLEGLGFETRANTIRQDRIETLLSLLPPHVTELSLGFGLESANEFILRVAVNKNERIADFEHAISEIAAVQRRHPTRRVVSDCYILLKPPFLTEAEAIDDAIRSVTWALDRGVETVTLFPNTLKNRTLCSHLAGKSDEAPPYRYQTPWLHSVFDVLNGLPPQYRRRTIVLGFTSGNPYAEAPRHCDLCWHVLHGLLAAHNYTRDPAVLRAATEVRCTCRRTQWEEISHPPPEPLFKRMPSYLSKLETEFGIAG